MKFFQLNGSDKRKKPVYYADDDVLLERETTRLQDFLSAQKFVGCSRFNQHSLGWWSGLRRVKHFSKFRRSADLATASRAANSFLKNFGRGPGCGIF